MLRTEKSSSVTKDVEPPGHGAVASPPSGWRSWLIPVATVLGFAIPAVSYLWMIHADGVNVISVDQWDDVILIGHAFSGTLHFSMLWAQHSEDRIFFPNLIVLALAYTTHLNVVTEEYLSALMLFGGTALLICAHKRRSPQLRWIWYCPVAFLLLSLGPADYALFGFAMNFYLVLLMVALALFLLDHEPQRWPVFGGAIAAAMVASFSSFKGLLVWPVGLLLIYLRRRSGNIAVAWIGSALLAGVIYFVGFNFNDSGQSPSSNPATQLTFVLQLVGDITGESQPGVLVTLFGSVLVVTAIWALIRFAVLRRTSTGGRPLALSLILFGLLFSVLTAYRLSGLGNNGRGVENHYLLFALFVLVGLYLAVLDPPVVSQRRSSERRVPWGAQRTRGQLHGFSDPLFTLARVVVGVGIVLTVILGSVNGLAQARMDRNHDLYLGQVTVRSNQYPDSTVYSLDPYATALSIRRWIAITRDDHLSLFGTGDAARYLNEKPLQIHIAPLHAAVLIPRNGSTVHGKQILDVLGSGSYDITRVDYSLSGPGRASASLARGTSTHYGWLAIWNTSSVPNGSYTIEATVDDSAGRSVKTSPVDVHVENRPRS